MRGDNEQIDYWQYFCFLVNIMLGVGILSLPARMAQASGSAAWLATLLATLMSLGMVWLLATLAGRFSEQTFAQYSEALLGTVMGRGVILLLIFLWLLLSALHLRTFAEVVQVFLLNHTPISVTIILMLFLVAYLVRLGVEPISRAGQLILPVALGPSLLIAILALPGADMTNFLPLLGKGVGKIFLGAPFAFFSFTGLEAVLFITPFLKEKQKARRAALLAVLGLGLLYTLMVAIVQVAFGAEETGHLLWPSLNLIRIVELPGAFVERLDALILSLWLGMVFLTASGYLFLVTLALSSVVRLKDHKPFVFPLISFLYFFSMLPGDLAQVSLLDSLIPWLLFAYLFFLAFLLLGLAKLKGGGNHET